MIRPFLAALAASLIALPAAADDPLLDEAVAFSSQIFFLDKGVPGLIIAAVRGDDSVVIGFGETKKGSGREPDGDTRLDIGSITKTFTGLTLADMVADGVVALTAPVEPYVDIVDQLPTRDGRPIRFVDLATHSSGLPRELAVMPGTEKYTDASFAQNIEGAELLFTPGEGVLYSNVAYDVLGMALAGAAKTQPFSKLVKQRVFDPLGLENTSFGRPTDDNAFQGYDWEDNEMHAPAQTPPNANGASTITTTANDMVRYLKWNLDRFGTLKEEARHLAHAAHLMRDGLDPVYGMDESGHMNAIGLGWVIMMPEGDRPLIIQKAGGAYGIFSYIAISPARNMGIFVAINEFNFSAGMEIATLANDLITTLAPR